MAGSRRGGRGGQTSERAKRASEKKSDLRAIRTLVSSFARWSFLQRLIPVSKPWVNLATSRFFTGADIKRKSSSKVITAFKETHAQSLISGSEVKIGTENRVKTPHNSGLCSSGFTIFEFSTLRIFHTPHFPHSAPSTLLIFHTPHFPHSALSTLRILHTPHLPHSTFSTLRTFHTPHPAFSTEPSLIKLEEVFLKH